MASETVPQTVPEVAPLGGAQGHCQQVATAALPSPKPRNRGGAPSENRNAFRHGLRSPRGPKGSKYVDQQANAFRRFVEDAVLAAHGEISLYHSALIHTSTEAARIAMGEMADLAKLAHLKPAEVTAKRQSALKAMALRDEKLKQLGINEPPPDPTTTPVIWQPDPATSAASRTTHPSPYAAPESPWTSQDTTEAPNVPPCDAEKTLDGVSTEGSDQQ